jgi:hypothetical protein
MNRSAITALQRLRQFQLEKEEWILQERQRDELEKAAACTEARALLDTEMNREVGTHPFHWKLRAEAVRELSNRLEQKNRHLRLAQKARNDQIQVVLEAKRQLEIVERLLERDNAARKAEHDMTERKLLDDLATSRAYRSERELLNQGT